MNMESFDNRFDRMPPMKGSNPAFYAFRCHWGCDRADDRRFSTLDEVAEFGRKHYETCGHIGMVHEIRPISLIDLGAVPGHYLPENGIRR